MVSAASRRAPLWSLVWPAAMVGALAGTVAGLAEAASVAAQSRQPEAFAELFGYAALVDGAALGGLAGAASLAAALLARLTRRRIEPGLWVVVIAAASCLLGGLILFGRWRQPVALEPGAAGPAASPLSVAIIGGALLVAALAFLLLRPKAGSASRALAFSRRVAPALLGLAIVASTVGVARDLSERSLSQRPGSTPGGSIAVQPAPSQPATSDVAAPDADATRGEAPVSKEVAPPAPGTPVPIPPAPAAHLPGPNVLLVTVDSLRADHIGPSGYAGARTPTLDRLAAEGVFFARNYTNRNATTPAHASIFTGAYPSTTGVRTHMLDLLDPSVPTLAESFLARGYVTAGIFSWLAFEPAYSGLERGFQEYRDLTINLPEYLSNPRYATLAATYKRLKTLLALPGSMDRQLVLSADVEEKLDGKGDVTSDGVLLWLEEYASGPAAGGRPFFLWVHYWDPHYPYTPPAAFEPPAQPDGAAGLDGSMPTIRAIQSGARLDQAQIARLEQYYDGEIAFADSEIGRLLQRIERMGLADRTLVVVMGDHGESFGDLGSWLHGQDLGEAEIHVPLIMRFPGRLPAGTVVRDVSRSVDVMPTILELFGWSIPTTVEGQSLVAMARQPGSEPERYAFSELADRAFVSIVSRDWHLLRNSANGSIRLFQWGEQGLSAENLARSRPDVVSDLSRRLDEWLDAHP